MMYVHVCLYAHSCVCGCAHAVAHVEARGASGAGIQLLPHLRKTSLLFIAVYAVLADPRTAFGAFLIKCFTYYI